MGHNAWVFVLPHQLPVAWSIAQLRGLKHSHQVIMSDAIKEIFDFHLHEFLGRATSKEKLGLRMHKNTGRLLAKPKLDGVRLGAPKVDMWPIDVPNRGLCVMNTFLEYVDDE